VITSHVFYHCVRRTKLILASLPLTNALGYLKDSKFFMTKVLFESKISRYKAQVETENRFQTLDHVITSHVFYHCVRRTKPILASRPSTNALAYLKYSQFFMTKVLFESTMSRWKGNVGTENI